MIKSLSLLIILCSALCASAQVSSPPSSAEKEVEAAVSQFVKAIEEADGQALQALAADELVYGHSNGKVQNKEEFIAEILSGQPFRYSHIQLEGQTIKVVNATAIVRHIFTAKTISPNTVGDLRIGNTLIWQLQNNNWKLLSRQAYRL